MYQLILILLTIFCASFIGTVSGFGIATTLMPIILLFFPIQTALLITGVIHWFASLWKLVFFRRALNTEIIVWFGVPIVLASALGAYLATFIATELFTRLVGLYLIIYALITIFRPAWRFGKDKKMLVLGGILSGFCAGLFGIRGAITSSFLAMYDLPKEMYLMTMGTIGIAVDTVRVGIYMSSFASKQPNYVWYLLAGGVPVSFIGAWLGQLLVHRVPQRLFYYLIAWVILAVGVRLLFF